MRVAYLNNRFVPLDKAKISVLDRGFQYGDGVFETMRSYKGVVFRLEKHIERLFKALKALGIRPKIKPPEIQKIIYKLLEKNKLRNAYIKVVITRGKSQGLLIPSGKTEPTVAIYALAYKKLPRNVYEKGLKVFLSKSRYNEKSKIAGKKTLNYLDNVLCRYEAKEKGFDDAILLNIKGFISEATSSNIFLVKRNKLLTPCPESGVLPGITRKEVIHLAKRFLKHKVIEDFIKRDALYSAQEIFLTNSLVEIMPVVKIDKYIVGDGKPGPVTKKLIGLFKDVVNN